MATTYFKLVKFLKKNCVPAMDIDDAIDAVNAAYNNESLSLSKPTEGEMGPQFKEICLNAVKQPGCALQYVKK